jgi:hypothetical protein
MGEPSYPAGLSHRVQARLKHPAQERFSRAAGLAAPTLAVLVVAALVLPRLQAPHLAGVGTPAPTDSSQGSIPAEDLAAAHLGNVAALVTRLNLRSSDGTVTLIGSYADPARTVLFFRGGTSGAFTPVRIDHAQGFLNASSSGGNTPAGDSYFVLDAGPRPGADGFAHLTAHLGNASQVFSFALKVQPSTALALTPPTLQVGMWTITTEALEVTPSVIHFQAVIAGATVSDIGESTIALVDAAGATVSPVAYGAGVTVPKEQLNSTTYRSTRVNVQWARPAGAATFELRIAGGGGLYRAPLNIDAVDAPSPPPGKGGTKAPPIGPTDFPPAQEALTLQGAFDATITSARPHSCGAGQGPSGPELFQFATFFQSGGAWYYLSFTTDASNAYKGPGTYAARAELDLDEPGPSTPLWAGAVQLTVTSDIRPDTGRVSGMLDWSWPAPPPHHQVTVGGSWTCMPGDQLGPA